MLKLDYLKIKICLIVTVFTSVYGSNPYSPSSRPIPDILYPPNGAAASKTS